MRKPSLVAAGVGVVFAVALAVSPAAAQQYPPSGPEVSVDDVTVVAGETFEVTITGSAPGDVWSFTFLSEPVLLGTATANANGVVTFVATVPDGATSGTHTVTGTNQAGQTVSVTVTVVSGETTTAGTGLPTTGSDTAGLVRVGGVLVAVGGVALLAARRRLDASREPEPDRI